MNNPNNYEFIKRALDYMLKYSNIETLTELARKAGKDPSTLTGFYNENRKSKKKSGVVSLSIDTLDALAAAIGFNGGWTEFLNNSGIMNTKGGVNIINNYQHRNTDRQENIELVITATKLLLKTKKSWKEDDLKKAAIEIVRIAQIANSVVDINLVNYYLANRKG